jgi:hypothetical protein
MIVLINLFLDPELDYGRRVSASDIRGSQGKGGGNH